MTRPIRDGSATATLAARLAMLPATSSAHGSAAAAPTSPRLGEQRGRRGHDHPIDRQRRERRDPPGLPVQRNEPVHVKVGHRARDQRQQRHTSGRRPPDPDVRPPGHRGPPRTSSPVIAGMYVPADSLLGHMGVQVPGDTSPWTCESCERGNSSTGALLDPCAGQCCHDQQVEVTRIIVTAIASLSWAVRVTELGSEAQHMA